MRHWLIFLKLFTQAAVLCFCGAQAIGKDVAARDAERKDIVQAERAILVSVTVATSSLGARLCAQAPVACVGPDRLDLALSLIAARDTNASLQALVGLVRFRLDGAYSEDYDDLLLSKGKGIEGFLSSLSPHALREQCAKEFSEFVRKSGSALGDTSEARVCRSEEHIQTDITNTLASIRGHQRREEQ